MQKWVFDIRSRTFFILLLAFFVLAYLAIAKIPAPADTSFEDSMQKIAGNKTMDLAMQGFSEIGWVLYPVFVAIVLFINKGTRRLGLILLLSLLIGTIAAAYMRCYTGYEKPALQFLGTKLPLTSGADVGIPCQVDGTFPAGHTVRTTLFAFIAGYALSRRFPRGCHLIWLYPALVSISRLYLLQEYPTTIAGGAILGILLADIMSKKLKIEMIFDGSKT
ncbi:MAG: phosphatase PAP2 family protein [Patescibacteria group bacterium]|nr:phosphatase PAP2 family protein [Patescibacteria group bacterium]